jgi:hypothetical protein
VRYTANGAYYQLRLEPGEEVVETLLRFCRARRTKSGFLTGLGAAEDIVLGCFDPRRRAYRKRTLKGDHEIAALVGNVAWDGKLPISHIHAVVSTPTLAVLAGHLFSARVTVTCEIALVPGSRRLTRAVDPVYGLKLLNLP